MRLVTFDSATVLQMTQAPKLHRKIFYPLAFGPPATVPMPMTVARKAEDLLCYSLMMFAKTMRLQQEYESKLIEMLIKSRSEIIQHGPKIEAWGAPGGSLGSSWDHFDPQGRPGAKKTRRQ